MRRDEQCSPVLVLLVCWPQCRRPRHAIRGDGSDGGRVVGRGTIKHMSIYGGTSSTVLYLSISFGVGLVVVEESEYICQRSDGRAEGQGQAAAEWQAWPHGPAGN